MPLDKERSPAVIGYIAGASAIAILIAAAVCLSGCATIDIKQPPQEYRELFHDIKGRITYAEYFKRDWRWVKAGEQTTGNCAVFAYTAQQELLSRNVPAFIKVCRDWKGTGHAYAYTLDGWAFDVRFKDVTTIESVNCE